MELILARWQFAITCVYHFFFVPLTLGLSLFIACMETRYVRTGDETYKKLTRFWGKLFVINFALGVVTGIVMEFQFGLNWSEYSRFVGDIFGVPLAIEALLAFFLESTFLGIWLFGWDKLSKKAHLATNWCIAIGSNLSAVWILIANSFMQEPVAYIFNQATGRAELTSFMELLTNPNVLFQFPHVVFGGMTTAAFFILGISAYHLLHKTPHENLFRRSLKYAAVYGLVAVILVMITGHFQGQHMVKTQPMKMAAAEGLWETTEGAGLSVVALLDEKNQRDLFNLRIPGLLSFIATNDFNATVQGIKDLQTRQEQKYGPGNYIPPVTITYWSFHLMVGTGLLMALMALLAFLKSDKISAESGSSLLKLLMLAIALPYIANSTGWILTEMGRVPWIVHGLMKIEDAVSLAVSSVELAISLVVFTLIYGILMFVDIYLLKENAVKGTD